MGQQFVNQKEDKHMANDVLRKALLEDALSKFDMAFQVSNFKALAEDLRRRPRKKSTGHQERTVIKHLLPYIKCRLELLELERRYAVLTRRVKFLQSRATHPRKLPLGLNQTIDGLGNLFSEDAQIVIRANNKKTLKLLAQIEADAPTMDSLLTDVAVPARSVLRPVSCLPKGGTKSDPKQPGETKPAGQPPTGGIAAGITRWWLDGRCKTHKIGK
jgi:hypothetical protein